MKKALLILLVSVILLAPGFNTSKPAGSNRFMKPEEMDNAYYDGGEKTPNMLNGRQTIFQMIFSILFPNFSSKPNLPPIALPGDKYCGVVGKPIVFLPSFPCPPGNQVRKSKASEPC